MYSVRVDKLDLLHVLRTNLEKHRTEYADATAKYPEVVMAELRKRASQIEAGNPVDLRFNLPEPKSFESEYEDAIQMLTWSEDATIELQQHEFKQYVQNEWTWQNQFAASTQIYNAR